MAVSKKIVATVVLRSTHVVLHFATLILIRVGNFMLPNPEKKGKLLEAAHTRTFIWMLFEIFFSLLASGMLICTLVNCIVKSPANAILQIKTWFQENCPNFSFFYYVFLSLFVLYGAMIGCNIPMLFGKIQIYPFKYPKRPTQTWQIMLAAGVAVGILNAILYFVSAFYPLDMSDDVEEVKTEEAQDSSKTEEPAKDATNEGEEAAAEDVEKDDDEDD